MAGGGAGFFHSIVSNPFDIAKTRLQVQHSFDHPTLPNVESNDKPVKSGSPQRVSVGRYKNTLHVFRAILLEEGIMGFTKGLVPLIMREIPIGALTYTVYEFVKSLSKK